MEGVRVRLDVGRNKEQRLLWLTRHAGRTLAASTRRGVQCVEEGPPRRRVHSGCRTRVHTYRRRGCL